MKQLVCPNCGEPIGTVERLKEIVDFCKEFRGQCSCGQKYDLRLSATGSVVLSFPNRQAEVEYGNAD